MSRPLPPGDLVYRVTGKQNDEEWFDQSGKLTIDIYAKCLAALGLKFADFSDILDWGCGSGRVLRWLIDETPTARLYGTDIDKEAITWLGANYPMLNVRPNEGLPPLPFDPGMSFNLVLAYSVFTHLDQRYQDAWLSELRARTVPGGILLLTIGSDRMWEYTMTKSDHPRLPELRALREKLDKEGFIFWMGDGWEQHFPDFYHTAFHSHDYIKRHWSRWFDVITIQEGSEKLPQDIVVLRRGT